jgi:hypothetical protein
MKRSDFDSVEAYKIYAKYVEQVEETISTLSKEDRLDFMSEIDSHIYESFISNKAIISEEERIKTVIRHLGNPQSYLKPVIAEKHLKQAVNTYYWRRIFKSLPAALLTGGQYLILVTMYLLIFSAGFLAIAKIFYPDKTGLFIEEGNFVAFGYISQMNAGAIELLGYWMIPASIVLSAVFYFFMTFILKGIIRIKTGLKLRDRRV